jgi:hypothetical protein
MAQAPAADAEPVIDFSTINSPRAVGEAAACGWMLARPHWPSSHLRHADGLSFGDALRAHNILYHLVSADRARPVGRWVSANLPRDTEAERWVIQRIGQAVFRSALMDYWNGGCPLTGPSQSSERFLLQFVQKRRHGTMGCAPHH